MKVLDKLTSLDLETMLFFCLYSIIGMLIVVYMTKKTLDEKKNASFVGKLRVILISVVFGGFIILFPWIAVINTVATILIFALLSFIIILSNIISNKKKL